MTNDENTTVEEVVVPADYALSDVAVAAMDGSDESTLYGKIRTKARLVARDILRQPRINAEIESMKKFTEAIKLEDEAYEKTVAALNKDITRLEFRSRKSIEEENPDAEDISKDADARIDSIKKNLEAIKKAHLKSIEQLKRGLMIAEIGFNGWTKGFEAMTPEECKIWGEAHQYSDVSKVFKVSICELNSIAENLQKEAFAEKFLEDVKTLG